MTTKEHPNGKMAEQNLPQEASSPAQSVDESRRRFTKSGLAVSGVLLTLASRSALGGGVVNGGGGGNCQSPSGFHSGNLSQHGTPLPGGYSCDHWINNCDSWKNICEQSKPFCTEFGFNHNNSSHYGCKVTYDFNKKKYSKDYGTYVPYTNLDILCRYHAGHKPSGYQSDCDVIKDRNGKITNTFYTSGTHGNITTYRPIDTVGDLDQLAQHCVAALINCKAGYTPFLLESTVKEMFKECSAGRAFHPTAGVDWNALQCIEYIKSTWNCA